MLGGTSGGRNTKRKDSQVLSQDVPSFTGAVTRCSTCSANHDTGTAASPNYILSLRRCDADIFLCPNRECERYTAEPAQRRCPTHTVGTATSRGETTSPTLSHLPVCPPRSWHRPRHLNLRVMELFGLSCHVLCHDLEDTMWWHSAVKQVPLASAPSASQKTVSPIRF